MKKRIHVNRHNIAGNKKSGTTDKPVFTVKTYRDNTTGQRVALLDDAGNEVAVFVYSPNKPLSCGAVAWLETSLSARVEFTDGSEVVVD